MKGAKDLDISKMANAIGKYTGLPGIIYFCTREETVTDQLKFSIFEELGQLKTGIFDKSKVICY